MDLNATADKLREQRTDGSILLWPDRPLIVLSGNSIDHLAALLGVMTAGNPAAPISVAYSLQSRDHARIFGPRTQEHREEPPDAPLHLQTSDA